MYGRLQAGDGGHSTMKDGWPESVYHANPTGTGPITHPVSEQCYLCADVVTLDQITVGMAKDLIDPETLAAMNANIDKQIAAPQKEDPDCADCAPCGCDDECDCTPGPCDMCGHTKKPSEEPSAKSSGLRIVEAKIFTRDAFEEILSGSPPSPSSKEGGVVARVPQGDDGGKPPEPAPSEAMEWFDSLCTFLREADLMGVRTTGLLHPFHNAIRALEARVKDAEEPCYCCRESGCDPGCKCRVEK
jgi:hypothetical protein